MFKSGNENPMWKENIKYVGIHEWIRRHKPKPIICEICGKVPPRELANISGNYLRDVNDFLWLCAKCHHEMDRKQRKKICKECNLEFETLYPNRFFCSRKCVEKNWKKNNLERWKEINKKKGEKYRQKLKEGD